jgi:diguanylate cyclase (GGDEF)-like protein
MPRFRLLDLNHDSPLAVGLIVGTAVVFHQPLRLVLNSVGAVEQQYHLDLLPALVVLCVVFMFHQYRKRQESRAVALAADTATQAERSRVSELNELVAIGQSLANALDFKEIEQALWRHLPSSLRQSPLSIAMRTASGWQPLMHDRDGNDADGSCAAELGAMAAARFDARANVPLTPIVIDGSLCLPVCAGRAVIGAAILPDRPETQDERFQQTLAPVLAFVGIAVRNVQLLAESKDDSMRDSLTRWFNRGHAMDVLRNDLRRGARSGNRPSILMMDLDGFKMMNDTLGHLQGDATLQAVSRTVTEVVRSTDVRCRYGGDEFLIILPETPVAGACQVAENIRRAITSMELFTGRPGERVTCSIGVAAAREGELEPEGVIARADAALYEAKRGGRNRVVVDGGGAVEPAIKSLRLVASGA